MKTITFPFYCIISLVLLISVSCEKDEKEPELTGDDYFPLHVGNYWIYERQGKIEISGKKTFDDKEYFQMAKGEYSTYYRKTSSGNVYKRNEKGAEGLIYALAAKKGDSWVYKSNDLEYKVVLSAKDETVKHDGCTFKNCYRFDFDDPRAVDEEHSIWLAPKIGIVMRRSGWFTDQKDLLKSKIDGVETEFAVSKLIEVSGIIKKFSEATTYQYGTHRIIGGEKNYLLRAGTFDLDKYLDQKVSLVIKKIEGYPLEGGPELFEVIKIQ